MWLLAATISLLLVAPQATAQRSAAADGTAWGTYVFGGGAAVPSSGAGFTASAALAAEVLPEYGPSFKQLTVQATPETPARLRVKIAPPGEQRWEVPEFIVQRPGPSPAALAASPALYSVAAPAAGDPLAVTVTRSGSGSGSSSSGGAPVFDTRGSRLVFKDQYIELTTAVPADADLYGLGEVTLPTGFRLPRDGKVITLWARDMPAHFPDHNLYGSHPFYLQVNKDGTSHGVLLLNSNGMDITLNADHITYRVIGGLIDLYFFMGPTPEEVVRQYHEVIGAPMMPPYWSLGLHQSRWGYPHVEHLEEVIGNYSAAGLPLETVWSDIEYMPHRFWTMAMDKIRYPVDKMRSLIDKLHAGGQQWIAITDAGVAADDGYHAYDDGCASGSVWIKDHTGEAPYLGQVWPGKTVYPDYLDNDATREWLRTHLAEWHKQVPFDGLWLDMNEASNFCSGMVCEPDTANETAMHWLTVETPHDFNITELIPYRTSCQMKCTEPPNESLLDNPPYALLQAGGLRLFEKTIAPSARHANGATQYDTHNLYGTMMAHDHHTASVSLLGKRPFLLSRSTFPGAGRFTAHWTGDNGANWENLYFSVAGILNTNLWGMSMVGADICGFLDELIGDNTKRLAPDEYAQLCGRWASAGAFYPFSRNHYSYNARSHEFYQWPSVTAAAKKAYTLRYRLLTYLYSSLFLAHTKGGVVAKALLFTDPTDATLRDANRQWLFGDAVLVSPVLTPNTATVEAHFTRGAWYSAWDYAPLLAAKGQPVTLDVPLGDVAVHLRGGAVVPMQPYAAVTRDVRLGDVTLVVALPAEAAGAAAASGVVPPYAHEEPCVAARARNPAKLVSCGLLFMDGGADLDVGAGSGLQVWYTAVAAPGGRLGTLTGAATSNAGDAKGKIALAAVHVLGVSAAVPAAVVQERAAAAAGPKVLINGQAVPAASVRYDAKVGAIKVSGLQLVVGEPLALNWSF